MPKINYKYEKRQKDIAKQKKREQKLKQRAEKKKEQEAVENGAGTVAEQPEGAGASGE
ncbi:MAG: hypothetical protein ABIJ39_02240 [Chloroflexota bacterium]